MQGGDRWLRAWAIGYAAVGAASLGVPLYAIELGAGALVVGLMASTAAFAGVPGALLWARLAARTHRRRPFVLVALGLTAGVLAVAPVLSTPATLLVANAALWFTVAAAAPVLNLVVVADHPQSAWDDRIATLNAWQGWGWTAGLLVGAGWTLTVPGLVGPTASLQFLLWLAAAAAGAGFVLARAWYPEVPAVDDSRFRRAYRRLGRGGWGAGRVVRPMPYGLSRVYWGLRSLRKRRPGDLFAALSGPLRAYLLAATVFFVGFNVFWAPVPAYLRAVDLTTDVVFLLFLASNLGATVCYGPVGTLTRRVDGRRLQIVALVGRGLLFPAIGAVGTVALTGRLLLGAGFFGIGVTWAVVAVTATGLVTRLAGDDVRADALGLYAAIGSLGSGLGGVLGGVLASGAGYMPAFVVAGAVVVAGAALTATAR